MTENHSRRTILRIASSATALSFTGSAVADDTSVNRGIKYDLSIRNNNDEFHTITVSISEQTTGMNRLTVPLQFGIEGRGKINNPRKVIEDISQVSNLSEGEKYEVEASLETGESNSVTFVASSNGLNDFESINISIEPDGGIFIGHTMA